MLRKGNSITKFIRIKKQPSTDKRIKKKCGLCGKTDNIIRTKCCNTYICYKEYPHFGERDCYENHYLFTVCGHHYDFQHEGKWQDCQKCKNGLMTERYVWYGTNGYNFVKLENPPSFEPTKCCNCSVIIKIGQDSYWIRRGDYYCRSCASLNGYPLIA